MKGAGESGVIVAAPAVVSAIENALEPFGVHIAQIPAVPAEAAGTDREGKTLIYSIRVRSYSTRTASRS